MAVAAALAGCGGGGGGDGTSAAGTAASAEERQPLEQRVEEARKKAEEGEENQAGGGQSGPEEGGRSGNGGNGGSPRSGGGSSSGGGEGNSTPHHHDSGGGTAQFLTPNGDNSIQETGKEASASEREIAAAALHAFYDDRAARNWDAACTHLAVSAVAAMEAAAKQVAKAQGGQVLEGCAEVLRAFSSAATHQSLVEAAESIDVGAFRVEGDHGLLLYHGVRGHDYAIQMIREDGAWKVGGLVGTPLS